MITAVQQLADEAGREIMRFYRNGAWDVTAKRDDSPLTQADLASNSVLEPGLNALAIAPVVSEEGQPFDVVISQEKGRRFWLVDPLDGTRDFIARTDTFVISIALIEDDAPIFGLVHAPVTGETWWAERGQGAFGPNGKRLQPNTQKRSALIAVGSRSMASERMQIFYDRFAISEVRKMGSALKFCKLAQGEVDLYPRFGEMYEWDTAAGQLIAEEAGCKVIGIPTGEPLKYGKPGYEVTGGFIAARGDLNLDEILAHIRSS